MYCYCNSVFRCLLISELNLTRRQRLLDQFSLNIVYRILYKWTDHVGSGLGKLSILIEFLEYST